MRLKINFFNRDTVVVAKELLGKYLVRRINGKVIAAKITETEAYCGQHDLACHASKGLTERTKIMFGPPGHAYVYLIYGMYHCLNVVTGEKGCPEAVLIRGCELKSIKYKVLSIKEIKKRPIRNTKYIILNTKLDGPGKLCRALNIDRNLNGVDICKNNELWIEDSGEKPSGIKRGKRIGVDYAGKWKDKLWRFFVDPALNKDITPSRMVLDYE